MSPLMYACRNGREKMVEILLRHKPDVNKQDQRGWTVSSLLRLRVGAARSLKMPESVVVVVVVAVVVVVDGVTNRLLDK